METKKLNLNIIFKLLFCLLDTIFEVWHDQICLFTNSHSLKLIINVLVVQFTAMCPAAVCCDCDDDCSNIEHPKSREM